MCKSCTSTQIVQENALFSGKMTQVTHILHHRRLRWSRQTSTLVMNFCSNFIHLYLKESYFQYVIKIWKCVKLGHGAICILDSNQIMEIGFCFVLTENFVIWKLHHANQLFLFDFLGKISIRLTILTIFCSLRRTITILY